MMARRLWPSPISPSSASHRPSPSGPRAAMASRLGTLYYSGQLTFDNIDVVSVSDWMGRRLSIKNGRSAWSSMVAPVQRVHTDIPAGRTTVYFGPPDHLSVQDLVAYLRGIRRQPVRWRKGEERTEGEFGDEEQAVGGDLFPETRVETPPGGPPSRHPLKVVPFKDANELWKIRVLFGTVWDLVPTMGGGELGGENPPSQLIGVNDEWVWIEMDKDDEDPFFGAVTAVRIEVGTEVPENTDDRDHHALAQIAWVNQQPVINQAITASLFGMRCGGQGGRYLIWSLGNAE